jgi:primosomal protein N' (replication factor Y)
VARVVVDVPLAHLDRTFDYTVPDAMADEVRAGCRVRVRFAGQLVDGFVVELGESSEHGGKLAPLAKLVSPEPVLTPAGGDAGPRGGRALGWHGHRRAPAGRSAPPGRGREAPARRATATAPAPDPAGFARYPTGPALLTAVAEGRPARAVWTALPGEDWPARLVELCQAALSGGGAPWW